MKYYFSRVWLFIICLLLVSLHIAPERVAQAQTALELTITPAFEGNYVPGTWLPLQVALVNEGAAFEALVVATLPGNPNRYTMPVELPGGSQKLVTLYVAMDQETRQVRVTIEHAGTVVGEQVVEVRPRTAERLMGLTTEQTLALALPRRQDLQRLPFTVFDLPPSSIPDQAPGLGSLTLLMLADITSASLSPEQQQALLGWIVNGGHLIIEGGSTAGRTLSGLAEPFYVATLGDTLDLDVAFLAEFVNGSAPASLPGIQLDPLPGTRSFGPPSAPLWVQRELGLGVITQLAFAPGLPALNTWSEAPTFWDRLLQPAAVLRNAASVEPNFDRASEQVLTAALSNLPASNLPPAGMLFLLLVGYTILIGPVVALMLRRADRQTLGWLLLPALALFTTAGGFGLAYLLRANQQIVSQISLIEQTSATHARVRTVVGLLTPQDTTFAVQIAPEALVRPLRSVSGLFGPISGTQGDFTQQAGAFQVAVNRWQLEGFIAEQYVDLANLDARIVLNGPDIQAEVYNTTDQTLHDVVVAYGEQLVRIGDIPPGVQQTAIWPDISADNPPRLGTALSYLVLREALDAGRRPGGVTDRRVLVREALINAAVTRGTQVADEGPLLLAWLEQSPLAVDVVAPGAATQQVALLMTRPTVSGTGAIALPPGWLRPDFTRGENTTCSGREGTGVSTQTDPMTVTLRLPGDFTTLQTTALTLTMQSERSWPNAGLTTELFDWIQQQWIDQNYDGPGILPVAQPERYVQNGTVRLRLSGRIIETQCLFVRTQLAGTLP